MEGGEHGKLAARVAAQVIEAYVNKQRKQDNNLQEAKQAPVYRWKSGRSGRTPRPASSRLHFAAWRSLLRGTSGEEAGRCSGACYCLPRRQSSARLDRMKRVAVL